MNEKIIKKARMDKLFKDKKYKDLKKEYFKIEIQYIVDAIKKEYKRLKKEEPDEVEKIIGVHRFLMYENNPYMFKNQVGMYKLKKYLFTDKELEKNEKKVKEKQEKLLKSIEITEQDYLDAEKSIKEYIKV